MVRAYNIFEISEWQKELEENLNGKSPGNSDNTITLPTLQRGFVWKPYQMEALWDSILRGYPIGALLISESNNRKDLLDGQQRCTTIALGFQNPFKGAKEVLNLKKENVPAIWLDIKPMEPNKYGLKFGVRVLTRSHPWGYKLDDHRSTLSSVERDKALNYLRNRCGDSTRSFTDISTNYRTPWDAHYPIPLNMLLNADTRTFEKWKKEVKYRIVQDLSSIETAHKQTVDYSEIEEGWFKQVFEGVMAAKEMLLPEIHVSKKVMTEDQDPRATAENDQDVTLFVRLNAAGTRISGEELVYSMLKAVFPEAKKFVEEIDLRYIAPSKLVNLLIRLTLMRENDNKTYQREVSITQFRSYLKDSSFKRALRHLIDSREAKKLFHEAIGIISRHPSNLPEIFVRQMISGTPDLLLVLLVYLSKHKCAVWNEESAIRSSFLHVFLFGTKKHRIASKLFEKLQTKDFSDWGNSAHGVINANNDLIPPLLDPMDFENILLGEVMKHRMHYGQYYTDEGVVKQILRDREEMRNLLSPKLEVQTDVYSETDVLNIQIDQASEYWINLCNPLFWKKELLVIAQREYFCDEFKGYMEFDGIEDTNQPWDWDHIYPRSWTYRRHGVSWSVKSLVNTNGNFRALSFNANRSESNRQSPQTRFEGNDQEKALTRKHSFIKESDLTHWLELTDSDRRLKNDQTEKVTHFVKAIFNRINNIYADLYSVITESKQDVPN